MDNSKCGSYAGWNLHMRNHEPVCDACRIAKNVYTRRYKAAARGQWYCAPGLGWPQQRRPR